MFLVDFCSLSHFNQASTVIRFVPSILPQWTFKVLTVSAHSFSNGRLRSTGRFSDNRRSLPPIGYFRGPSISKPFMATSFARWFISMFPSFPIDFLEHLCHNACILELLIFFPKLQSHARILDAVMSLLLYIFFQEVPCEEAQGQLALLGANMKKSHCIQNLRLRDMDVDSSKIRRQTMSNEDAAKIQK